MNTKLREYVIEASEAGYRVWVLTNGQRFPLDDVLYPSLVSARDQIPKRSKGNARLVHRTAYTEMINTPAGTSPPLNVPLSGTNRV